MATANSYTGPEDTPISGNAITDDTGAGADSDADGDSLTLDAASIGTFTTTAGGSITLAANGNFTYTPPANFNGTDTFDYTVSDTNGGTDTQTLSFNITPVNDDPVAGDDVGVTAEDTSLVVGSGSGLLDNDTDVDGDVLSVTAFSVAGEVGPFVLGVAYTIGGVGDVTINGDGSYSFVPVADFNGSVPQVTYNIEDGNGGTASSTLDITITPVNDDPVANPDTASGAEDGGTVAGDVLANDIDVDGDTISVVDFTVAGIPVTFPAGSTGCGSRRCAAAQRRRHVQLQSGSGLQRVRSAGDL